MIILIDAYNFLKSISAHKFVDDRVIQSWILQFQNYMNLRGNKIVLVFDAGPFFYQTRDVHGGVEVIYAGHEKTADDVLKIWLERNALQDVLLVTSDRQVRDYALNLNVVSISSQDFYKVFKSVMHQEEAVEQKFAKTLHKMKNDDDAKSQVSSWTPIQDPDINKNQNLDELMEQASRNLVAGQLKTEYTEKVQIRSHSKISKADRQIMKKIDKI